MDIGHSLFDGTAEKCRDQILSNEYADFIYTASELERRISPEWGFCAQPVSRNLAVIHVNRAYLPPLSAEVYDYGAVPKLYGLTDTMSMEAAGILRTRNQPVLSLRGKGVLIGLVDTGIDYRNPAFFDEAGKTRILRIWDQTVQTGRLPEGFLYGSEYTNKEIDEAIRSDNAFTAVPSEDENGHGTFLASVCAGNENEDEGFTGAAPDAYIAAVKLKPAKQYLRDYYLIKEGAAAYQETDLLTGIQYLGKISRELSLPLVILLGTGTNLGGHTGVTPLSQVLNEAALWTGTAIVVPAGNESNRSHHYFGKISQKGGSDYVEIRIPQNERGITLELWADMPEVYGIQILTPTGESTARVVPRLNQNSVFQFTMEKTVVYVDYQLVERDSGSLVVKIRIADPTPGIWTLAVYNEQYTTGQFHIWLPMEGFAEEETVFLRPNPDTTLTDPAAAAQPITFGAYDHRLNGIYIHSGRGFTRDSRIKPDLVAPGVNILGALPGGNYGRKSGTSVAAAHGAGAAALLLEWGIVQGNYRGMRTSDIKSLMIRGARRAPENIYPNKTAGYGALDLFHVFETISL